MAESEPGDEEPQEENDLEQLMAVLDHHIQEAGNQTNETEEFLAEILDKVWTLLTNMPGYEEVVCYKFKVEPLGNLIDREIFIEHGTARVKIAGYSYDTSDQLEGPGYHTFNIDLNNQLICPIFLPPAGTLSLRPADDAAMPVGEAR